MSSGTLEGAAKMLVFSSIIYRSMALLRLQAHPDTSPSGRCVKYMYATNTSTCIVVPLQFYQKIMCKSNNAHLNCVSK